MSDAIRTLTQQLTGCMNRHDAEAASSYFAEDVLFWEPSYDEPRRGRDAVKRELEGFFAMLPDIKFTTLALVVDGDIAFHEWQYQATYQSRPVRLRECAVSRHDAEGRVTEVRVYFDRLSLLRQLGLMQEE